MKLKYCNFLMFAIGIALASCNDSFLDENQQNITMLAEKALISSHNADPSLDLNLGIAGSEKYYVAMYPKWMVWDSMHGKFENGATTLKFKVVEPEVQTGSDFLTGTVVLDIDRIGMIGFEVVYGNIGNVPGHVYSEVKEIAGIVMDAAICKPADILVIATQYPNQLLIYKTPLEQTTVVPLGKSPQCIDISGDGKSVFVGCTTPFVSLVSLESFSVQKDFRLDCVPFDIVTGDNGWCYIAPQGDSQATLCNLNLTTGESFFNSNPWFSNMYGNAFLKKVPGKPLIISTRTLVSPTGVLLLDISRGMANDTIKYWHENPVDLWISNDGNRMVTKEGIIHPVPVYTPTQEIQHELPQHGKLKLQQLGINDVDFCDTKNSLFAANGDNWQPDWKQLKNNVILQFDANNLSLLNTYEPSYTAVRKDDALVFAYSQVRYLYSNQAGTQLFAIRRTAPDFDLNQWSIEKFKIK